MSQQSDIWSLDDAAAHFKCSTKTVQKMARENGLPYFMMGRLWRFRAEDALAWEKSQMQTSKKAVA